ncbi:hypothetical protein VIN01S_31600 [Vibrio inusitatus NBRC 102082]|uniref:TOD1/MUCI70 glycosyltransferase-like domain-containing protein n=1 Tax=Vibrio inusitatus NBRC 102082 TaxID=1219070 RepID=A0A4Y3HYY7_9VIBR|nr:glycosyltransferase domain-containing protein [Vibrio inusitatus]GEA52356.1 hypothetical protein VIN01S_31600 [Vibrio inusitatus NBRC 102082]
MRKKIALYTVLAGEYDELNSITLSSDIEAFLISDRVRETPKGWKLIVIDKEAKESNVTFNRKFKIQPSLLFSDYDMTIYVDSNIEVKSEIKPLINQVSQSKYELALYRHPQRSSVYEEADDLKRRGYDYFFNVDNQMTRYKEQGFKSKALYEANIIVRKNTSLVNNTMKLWWDEFSRGVKRDQLSLTYSCFKTGLEVYCLGKHDGRFVNKYFYYHPHLKKNASNNIIAKIVNRLWEVFFLQNKRY